MTVKTSSSFIPQFSVALIIILFSVAVYIYPNSNEFGLILTPFQNAP